MYNVDGYAKDTWDGIMWKVDTKKIVRESFERVKDTCGRIRPNNGCFKYNWGDAHWWSCSEIARIGRTDKRWKYPS